jgi:hypothetical protein
MREPFRSLLPKGERLVAAGEAEPGVTTGPLASLSEILALFSPLISVILLIRLDGALPKVVGVLAPPAIAILLARWPLRRWHRPREWIGVTDRRLLVWRRRAALRVEPRIETVPLDGIVGVEMVQDRWDQVHGTHQIILHRETGTKDLARLHNAERVRDAIVALVGVPAPAVSPAVPPADFLPPAPPPGDFRP